MRLAQNPYATRPGSIVQPRVQTDQSETFPLGKFQVRRIVRGKIMGSCKNLETSEESWSCGCIGVDRQQGIEGYELIALIFRNSPASYCAGQTVGKLVPPEGGNLGISRFEDSGK